LLATFSFGIQKNNQSISPSENQECIYQQKDRRLLNAHNIGPLQLDEYIWSTEDAVCLWASPPLKNKTQRKIDVNHARRKWITTCQNPCFLSGIAKARRFLLISPLLAKQTSR
jgi:hypothetical protein